ncbi:MAG: SAM-dependent methyltransferase [Bythopirellula sp.]
MLIELAERRWLPDALVRIGIRQLLRSRLQAEQQGGDGKDRQARMNELFATGPIAIDTVAANEQHYEVPAAFYQQMLGPHLKYSSCWWEEGCRDLDQAEAAMLRLTCQRAQLTDGQRILELGCGWGALTLWMAKEFPQANILAISNSRSQQEFIQQQCRNRQLQNVEIRLLDVAQLSLDETFDRVVSVEMFEHMRNWQQLLANVAGWLHTDGKCFLHTFCHRQLFYPFEVDGQADWMAKHFFSGGVMPSYDLLQRLDLPLQVEQQWQVNGQHYAKTCRAWLMNLDRSSRKLEAMFAEQLGGADARRQLARWRMFVMACAELFAFADGNEWFVSHTLLNHG